MPQLIQLKSSNGFSRVVGEFRRADALVMCEGRRDAEVFKHVLPRCIDIDALGDVSIAIIDAEGMDTLRTMVMPTALALIVGKVVRRTKSVVVIVDAEDRRPEERMLSFKDSLESRGFEVRISTLCTQTWRMDVRRDNERMPILVAVSGVFEGVLGRFRRHSIDDHILTLKIRRGVTPESVAWGFSEAKMLVEDDDLKLIDDAEQGLLEESFPHVCCVAKSLRSVLSEKR